MSITFHHYIKARRGRTNPVLCLADVFAVIELSRFDQFQSGNTICKVHRASVGLAQLSISFKPSYRDVRSSRNMAFQGNRLAHSNLHWLHLFNKVWSF